MESKTAEEFCKNTFDKYMTEFRLNTIRHHALQILHMNISSNIVNRPSRLDINKLRFIEEKIMKFINAQKKYLESFERYLGFFKVDNQEVHQCQGCLKKIKEYPLNVVKITVDNRAIPVHKKCINKVITELNTNVVKKRKRVKTETIVENKRNKTK